jgi:hypothetical protein
MQMPSGKHLRIPWVLASPQDDGHGYTQARLGACRPGSAGLAGRYACTGWTYLVVKIHFQLSFVAPPILRRLTNGRGASGLASCAMRRPASGIPSRWISSSARRADQRLRCSVLTICWAICGNWEKTFPEKATGIPDGNMMPRPCEAVRRTSIRRRCQTVCWPTNHRCQHRGRVAIAAVEMQAGTLSRTILHFPESVRGKSCSFRGRVRCRLGRRIRCLKPIARIQRRRRAASPAPDERFSGSRQTWGTGRSD